jgi:hypothetical protein
VVAESEPLPVGEGIPPEGRGLDRKKLEAVHLPPETGEWHETQHRSISHITRKWGGNPLVAHEGRGKLIATTMSAMGVKSEGRIR